MSLAPFAPIAARWISNRFQIGSPSELSMALTMFATSFDLSILVNTIRGTFYYLLILPVLYAIYIFYHKRTFANTFTTFSSNNHESVVKNLKMTGFTTTQSHPLSEQFMVVRHSETPFPFTITLSKDEQDKFNAPSVVKGVASFSRYTKRMGSDKPDELTCELSISTSDMCARNIVDIFNIRDGVVRREKSHCVLMITDRTSGISKPKYVQVSNRLTQEERKGRYVDGYAGTTVNKVYDLTVRWTQENRVTGEKGSTGFLLHGPPGSGKSSMFSESICYALKMSVCRLKLSTYAFSLKDLDTHSQSDIPCIYVFEELDHEMAAITELYRKNSECDNPKEEALTSGVILSILEGSMCAPGSIIVATSNNKESLMSQLPYASFRCGRLFPIKVDDLTGQEIYDYVKSYHGWTLPSVPTPPKKTSNTEITRNIRAAQNLEDLVSYFY